MRSSFLWRNRVALTSGALILLAAHLLSTGVRPGQAAARPGALLMELLRPAQVGVQQFAGAATGLWRDYLDLVNVRRENSELRAQLAQLTNERARTTELETENRHLSELLQLRDVLGLKGVAANVIGSDAIGLSRTLILSAGSRDGLKPGMAVVCNQGVVGKTIAVSRDAARVLLVDDHNSALDAYDQQTRTRGIVAGVVDDGLTMKYVDRADVVKPGDTVVTSGLDGIFPRGLLIGTISQVTRTGPGLFLNVGVKAAVDFRNLEQVLVITEQPPAPPPAVRG